MFIFTYKAQTACQASLLDSECVIILAVLGITKKYFFKCSFKPCCSLLLHVPELDRLIRRFLEMRDLLPEKRGLLNSHTTQCYEEFQSAPVLRNPKVVNPLVLPGKICVRVERGNG